MLVSARASLSAARMGSSSDTQAIQDRPKGLQMVLPAKSENVAVIRHALAGLAEEIGMDEPGLADLKTVVTEACMNVVVHAYQGQPGPLSVEAEPDESGLTVVVRDEGAGIKPQADAERDSLRLGLSLIAALSSSFSISGGLDQGTVVTMRVPLQGGGANGSGDPVEMKPFPAGSHRDGRSTAPSCWRRCWPAWSGRWRRAGTSPSIGSPTRSWSPTRSPARRPSGSADGRVRLGLDEREGGIDLRLGPMEPGAASRIREELEVPDVGGSLEALADELTVEESGDGEYLIIRFAAAP